MKVYSRHPLSRARMKPGKVADDDPSATATGAVAAGADLTLADAHRVIDAVAEGALLPMRRASNENTIPCDSPDLVVPLPLGKRLTAAQERALALRWQTLGDVRARDVLVERNRGLVPTILKQQTPHFVRGRVFGEHHEDAYSEGCLGLVRAVETYDPTRNVRFSTYACTWIRARLQRYADDVRRECEPRVGNHTGGSRDDLTHGDLYEADWFSGAPVRRRAAVLSLDAPMMYTDGDVGDTLVDAVATPAGLWGSEMGDDVLDSEESRALVSEAIDAVLRDPDLYGLTHPEMESAWREHALAGYRDVVLRLNGESGDTLDDIGRKHGYSREGARLLEKRLVTVLRAVVSGVAPSPKRSGGRHKPPRRRPPGRRPVALHLFAQSEASTTRTERIEAHRTEVARLTAESERLETAARQGGERAAE